ncbi:ATP-binding protein [Pontibaca salina]|uniref:histidine kinase n=1 Tax=Pontibaca salina TaxID=2795731 RepID=A0A934HPR0_9RHOB|nr:ATP-binding protein [Pontibaca salina]MBI6628295.1 GHKL domain-containing protein [Pontibaca salina]
MDQHRLQATLSIIPLPIVVIGADDRIDFANPAGEAIVGANQIGRHHALALRQPALLAAIEAALRQETTGWARYEILGPSYQQTYRVTVSPISLDDMPGALCAFEDITEKELIGQFRRDFIANVSHELRTPLTTLMGFIETLQGTAKDDPAARERFLAIMQREAERMNRLVQELLSLSKVEAQERQRPSTRVNIVELVNATATSLRPVADEAGIELEILGLDTAPDIRADADQLTQVLQNLIENALKYGSDGKRITVNLRSRADDPKLRIDVIDRGEGIDAMHLPRLTERFYRIDDHRSREKGGTGLGLSIVKHILNRHGGQLEISSERGKGSCFSVILPKAD